MENRENVEELVEDLEKQAERLIEEAEQLDIYHRGAERESLKGQALLLRSEAARLRIALSRRGY